MARKAKGMKPSINQWEDFTDDLGWVDPEFLYAAIEHVGIYVYDVETTGLNPRNDRLEGIAFYVPAGKPKDFGPGLGYYDGKPLRVWYPFRDWTFMCHVQVKDIPDLESKIAPIGVDIAEIYRTAEGKDPGELILVNLRPPMDQEQTMEALRPIWQELHDVVGITHHGKFDNSFLWVCPGTAHPIRVKNVWGDSMLADFCSDERRKRYALKIRVKQEFNHQMTPYAEAVRGQSLLAFCNAKPLGVYACLHDSARVVVAGGETLSIGEIVNRKLDVRVASWNAISNKIEYKKITGWHRSQGPKDQQWIKIRTRYGLPNQTVAEKKSTVVTPDHEIWTARGWVEAQDIKVGDAVLAPECALSSAQEQLVLGSLLGDGFLQNPRNLRASFAVAHAAKATDYVSLKQTLLGQHLRSIIRFQNEETEIEGRSVKGGPADRITSCAHSGIAALVGLCYPDGVRPGGKRVSQAWLDRLDERGLCFFYLDDGTLGSKDRSRGFSVRFITHDHGENGTSLIRNWLESRFGLNGVIDLDKRKSNGWSIRLNDASSRRLFEIIAPFVPPGMSYKLGREWEDRFDLAQFGQVDVTTPVHDEVLAVEPYLPKRQESRRARYCLTIEGNNNFFTQSCLVHNCDDCYWEYRLHQRAIEKLREQEPPPKNRTDPRWTVEKKFGRVMGRLERVYWGIDTRISEIIMEMQNAGVLIDWQWLQQVNENIEKEKEEIWNRMETFLGWPLNPNATKQVADALFAPPPDGLGLPQAGIPVGKSGDPSTSDKVIKHFSRFHPLVADILKWRSLDTVQGGFVTKLIKLALESPDGRVYSRFNQTRTVIARLSCVSGSTILDTSNGSVRIADLDLSDGRNYTIETHRGRQRRILRRFYKGREEMFDVETEDGRKITCTAKHRFLTPQGWRALGDLGAGDRLIVRAGVGLARASEALEGHQEGIERGELRSDLHRGAENPDRADGTLRRLLPGAHALPEALRSALLIAVESSPVAQPLASDARQRSRQARQRDQASSEDQEPASTSQTGDNGSSGLEGREDRPRTRNDRASRSPEHQALWNPARLPAAAATSACRVGGVGTSGTAGAGVHEGGREVLRRASRILRDDLLSNGEAHAVGGRPQIVRTQPPLLRETRSGPSGSHCVVAEPQRASTLARIANGGDSSRSGVLLLQELESGLLLSGSQAAGGGGRGVSLQGRDDQGARQAQAEEGQGTRLHGSEVLDQTGGEGVGIGGHEDPGFTEATIVSIESVGIEDVWDIEVEGDHSYVAHGFVNHNSSDPINFQNQPRDKNLVRKAYCSHRVDIETDDKDMLLLGGDYGQIELRTAAHLSQEENMIEVYKMGGICTAENGDACDRYKVWVCEAEGCDHKWTPELWTAPNKSLPCPNCGNKEKTEHQARCRHVDLHQRTAEDAKVKRNPLAKNLNFGLLYRMGAPKFCIYADLFDSDGLPMVEFAKEVIQRWHAAYPAIAVFHEITEFNLEKHNWIAKTLFGRRRRLDQEARINRFRAVTQGIQFQVSGTAQDIMKTGMIRVADARQTKIDNSRPAARKLWERFRFLMQIHDEVVMEVHRDIEAEAKALVKEAMEGVGRGHLRVPLAFDVKTGRSWDDVH